MTRIVPAIAGFLMLVAAVFAGVWWVSYRAGLDRLADRGQLDLSLASARLLGALQQYRELAVVMAEHPTLQAALRGDPAAMAAAETVLLRTADKTNTLDLHVVGPDGRVRFSSQRKSPLSEKTRADMPSFRRAMQGALGVHHQQIDGVEGRAFVFSAPVFAPGGGVLGTLDVDVNIWEVESAWLGDPQAIYFTDAAGVVFITNRNELLFRTRDLETALRIGQPRYGYARDMLSAFPAARETTRFGHEVWALDGGRYLPQRALHLVQDLPVIGMRGELLLSVDSAARIAWLQAIAVSAVILIFGGLLLIVSERRRALSERLRIEAAANARLEERVRTRTRALSDANATLRHEVAERLEAEAALKRAQQDLVQAGKLSALGKMSAGLSHELNQPLMAIRSFAENANLYLERGAPEKAAENLTRISELGRRMGRIIRNLRAFARQETEPMTDVDLVAVIDTVLELSAPRIAADQVTLVWARPDRPVMARGGEVRLQQVVLNLVTNALDAMGASAERRLDITLDRQAGRIALSVADTGSGIAEPEKIFDPFYSTKEVGQSEGMGLGLSISYGLLQSFGGSISGRNRDGGGAVFTILLDPAKRQEAA
ncbi:sensor histidine kinase [Actibacterium ureilyticum]|uniref:sensor histidine kinase n=1 Tax=Actibacterium ureilyticum TaxID=1590614 RepID=UPI000BAADA96|nr:ATP-binding protein [Actibacterium ureilyticum]